MMSSDRTRPSIASERLRLPSLLGQKGLLKLVLPGRIAHEGDTTRAFPGRRKRSHREHDVLAASWISCVSPPSFS